MISIFSLLGSVAEVHVEIVDFQVAVAQVAVGFSAAVPDGILEFAYSPGVVEIERVGVVVGEVVL